MQEHDYDPGRAEKTIEGAFRRVGAVFEEAYEEFDENELYSDELKDIWQDLGYRDEVQEAIGMVEGLPSAIHEGENTGYSEDDLLEATKGLNELGRMYRRIDDSVERILGQDTVRQEVADTIRTIQTVLEQDVHKPAQDYGDIEPLELEGPRPRNET